ncbi:MAG: hypothetical protein EXR74_01510 [Bdellovibrionales bacterium]|nr:hypothetical protein [Bdellovibrionales bacterium]
MNSENSNFPNPSFRNSQVGYSSAQSPMDILFFNFLSLLKRHIFVVLVPVLIAEAIACYYCLAFISYQASSHTIIQKADNSSLQAISVDLGASRSQLLSPNLNKDTYLETVLLYLRSRDFFEESAKNIMETEEGQTLVSPLTKNVPSLSNLIRTLLKKPSVNKETNKMTVERLAGLLQSVTKVDKGPISSFYITVTTSNPNLSVKIAENISAQAILLTTRRDLKQLEDGKSYIVSKLDEITDYLSEIEKEMLVIRKRSSGPISQKGITDRVSSFNGLKTDLEENRLKLEQNDKLIKSITSNINLLRNNSKSNNLDLPTIAIINRQLVALEARRKGILAEGTSPDSPQAIALDEEIEKTKKQLPPNNDIKNRLQKDDSLEFLQDNINPEIRISELRKENWYLRSRINAGTKLLLTEKLSQQFLPEDEQKYYALNKRLEMRYLLFGELSKQLFNIDVSRISIQNRITTIERPSKGRIVKTPSLFPTLPMALILSLVFGSLLATLIEKHDPTIINQKDFPGLNYISLGGIPLLKSTKSLSLLAQESASKSLLLKHKLDLPQTIPFKRIRTRILQLEKKTLLKSQVISIHSTHSGDGKSFITGNLAGSMAALNKKVLLMDIDLRRKAISREFTKSHSKGLSTFLEELKLTSYQSLIIPNIQPNLDLFPSGPAIQKSTELLNLPKFSELLSKLKESYDFIFLDNPPFLALPDSEIVAGHSDIIIIVASSQKTKVHDLGMMLDQFLQFGDKTVCTILNRTPARNQLYYYYGTSENDSNRRVGAA